MAEMVISLKQWVRNTTGLNMIFASELEQKSNDKKKMKIRMKSQLPKTNRTPNSVRFVFVKLYSILLY